ncbi:MAG: hypothetical protein QOK20_1844 [Acidimicrobiaceae bacterium]|nr:hypothetical protein [Acidimicrobiaceae bacterium]
MGEPNQLPPAARTRPTSVRNARRLRLLAPPAPEVVEASPPGVSSPSAPLPTPRPAPPSAPLPTVSTPTAPPVAGDLLGELEELDEIDPGSLLFPKPQAFWVRQVVGDGARPARFAAWQVALKRSLDLLIGTVLLVITLPLIALAAIAIKVHDGGPVLFRQTRVGRHGRKFTILKLRTMVPDADKALPLLASSNGRTGPLFKMLVDPRVTPVGRLLRSSSIDELPQLLNVISGSMSLVGPRPALPAEVAQFGKPLMVRLHVKPGITGLWQVEARDDPAFERYQKLDLYYVRNWSIRLDLAILLATFRPVVHRLYRSARGEASELSLGKGDGATTASVLD